MSLAATKPQAGYMKIPDKPEAIQAYEQLQRAQRADGFFGACTFYARGPGLVHPMIQGAMIANYMLDHMMQAAIVAQSRLLLPEGAKV